MRENGVFETTALFPREQARRPVPAPPRPAPGAGRPRPSRSDQPAAALCARWRHAVCVPDRAATRPARTYDRIGQRAGGSSTPMMRSASLSCAPLGLVPFGLVPLRMPFGLVPLSMPLGLDPACAGAVAIVTRAATKMVRLAKLIIAISGSGGAGVA